MENLHLNAPRATHIQLVYRIHFLLYDKVCSLSFARSYFLILPSVCLWTFQGVSRVFWIVLSLLLRWRWIKATCWLLRYSLWGILSFSADHRFSFRSGALGQTVGPLVSLAAFPGEQRWASGIIWNNLEFALSPVHIENKMSLDYNWTSLQNEK